MRDLSDVWLRFAGAHRLQFSDQIGLIIRENRQTFRLSLDFAIGDQADIRARERTLSEGTAAPIQGGASLLPRAGVGSSQLATVPSPSTSSATHASFIGANS